MSLSQYYEPVRHGRSLDRGDSPTLSHGGQVSSMVEAITELSKIARPVLVSDRVIGSVDGVLDVAKHRIDPVQALAPTLSAGPPHDCGAALATGLAHRFEAAQVIGAQRAPGCQSRAAPLLDLARTKCAYAVEAHSLRPALRVSLHHCDKGRLATRAAPALVAAAAPAPVSIVDLNKAGQGPCGVALEHRFASVCA